VFLFVKTCISAKLLFYILSRKGFEICAVELQTKLSKLIILSSYKVPTGDFNQLKKNLDDALKYLYKPKVELLVFGDINTDCLFEN
jgi:hypothetical protein